MGKDKGRKSKRPAEQDDAPKELCARRTCYFVARTNPNLIDTQGHCCVRCLQGRGHGPNCTAENFYGDFNSDVAEREAKKFKPKSPSSPPPSSLLQRKQEGKAGPKPPSSAPPGHLVRHGGDNEFLQKIRSGDISWKAFVRKAMAAWDGYGGGISCPVCGKNWADKEDELPQSENPWSMWQHVEGKALEHDGDDGHPSKQLFNRWETEDGCWVSRW